MGILKQDASFSWSKQKFRAEITIIGERCNQDRDFDKADLEILILMNNNC